jgi:hypothetical protein
MGSFNVQKRVISDYTWISYHYFRNYENQVTIEKFKHAVIVIELKL